MVEVIGLGAGGHAKVVIEIVRDIGGFEIIGLVDPKRELWGTTVMGVPVLGDDNHLNILYGQGVRNAFIGLGTVGDTRQRRHLYNKARQHGFQIIKAIHPRAIIAESVEIGHGPTIMAGVIINIDVTLGNNVIVNTGAIIEHDCLIDDHVHVATGAQLASTVHVGEGTHIGVGACIRQGIDIGREAIIGAGAVVIADVPDNTIVVGVPARIVKKVEE